MSISHQTWHGREDDGDAHLPFVVGMVDWGDGAVGRAPDTAPWAVYADWLEERGHEWGPMLRALADAEWVCESVESCRIRRPVDPWAITIIRTGTTHRPPTGSEVIGYTIEIAAARQGVWYRARIQSSGPVADVLAPTGRTGFVLDTRV